MHTGVIAVKAAVKQLLHAFAFVWHSYAKVSY